MTVNLNQALRHAWQGVGSSRRTLASLVLDLPELLRVSSIPIGMFRNLLRTRDYHRDGEGLIYFRHGIATGARALNATADRMNGSRIDNHQVDFTRPLLELAPLLLEKVVSGYEMIGRPVRAFGHSKGAAEILLAYRERPDLFDRIVTLGVPYHGSEWASYLKPLSSLWELRPGSPTIRRLSDGDLPRDADILNFYTMQDEFVRHPERSILPDQDRVRNVLIQDQSHNGLLYDPVVQTMAALFLRGVEFGDGYRDELMDGLPDVQRARADRIIKMNRLNSDSLS